MMPVQRDQSTNPTVTGLCVSVLKRRQCSEVCVFMCKHDLRKGDLFAYLVDPAYSKCVWGVLLLWYL